MSTLEASSDEIKSSSTSLNSIDLETNGEASSVACHEEVKRHVISNTESHPDFSVPDPKLEAVQNNSDNERCFQLEGALADAQKKISALLDEKQKWLDGLTSAASNNGSRTVLSELKMRLELSKRSVELIQKEKEAVVVKFAVSEQARIKAQREAKALYNKLQAIYKENGLESSECNALEDLKSQLETSQNESRKLSAQLESITKTNATLKAKNASQQEIIRTEQQKLQSLNENVNQLTKELEKSRKAAKELERLRQREADRLVAEVAMQEKLKQATEVQRDCNDLRESVKRIPSLETEVGVLKDQVQDLLAEREKLAADYALLHSDQERNGVTSEFVKELTQSNSKLRADHLRSEQERVACESKLVQCNDELLALKEANDALRVKAARVEPAEAELVRMADRVTALEAELVSAEYKSKLVRQKDRAVIKDLARQLTKMTRTHPATVASPSPTGSVSSLIVPPDEPGRTIPALGNGLIAHGQPAASSFPEPYMEKMCRLNQEIAELRQQNDLLQDELSELRGEVRTKNRLIQECVLVTTQEEENDSDESTSTGSQTQHQSFSLKRMMKSSTEENASLRNALSELRKRNRTMKESLRTLGEEISCLRDKNRALKTYVIDHCNNSQTREEL